MNIKQQSGMTLIELMLAGVLGIVASYFIMNIMVASAKTSKLSEGIAQAQETGRLVMSWIKDSIVDAGYSSNYLQDINIPPILSLCNGNPAPPANNGNCTFDTDSNANGGDRLAIQRTAGGLTPSNRDIQTCTGEALAASIVNNQAKISDVYWIMPNTGDSDSSNDYQLWCVTYDENGVKQGTAQSIASGIESMQILIGETDNSGTNLHFVSPANVADWTKVIGVRIALLAREFGDNTLTSDTRSYGLLNSDPVTNTDQIARYVQNGTIWFPNTRKL